MKTTVTTRLDADTIENLAPGLTPIDPPAEVQVRLRERIMQRAAEDTMAQPYANITVHSSAVGWVDVAPLISVKTLFESADGKGVLFRFEPGARLPAHGHDTDEECIVLEGELRIGDDMIVRAGDFHLARKGIPHGEMTAPLGALFYIRTGASFKFRPLHTTL
jgi:quercetin dioxygenase-like cupin family protein